MLLASSIIQRRICVIISLIEWKIISDYGSVIFSILGFSRKNLYFLWLIFYFRFCWLIFFCLFICSTYPILITQKEKELCFHLICNYLCESLSKHPLYVSKVIPLSIRGEKVNFFIFFLLLFYPNVRKSNIDQQKILGIKQ